MGAPETILKLCETFSAHKQHYKSAHYNETELRREFLDPFFKALGWDVDNEAGYADAYKDVIHEDAIKMGGYTKAPDYCFRIGGARKFFVEAKKPSTDIHGDSAPAYQLRRYGWSAKLPLSILSDFEELAVYDTRIRPAKGDKPAKGRTLYFTYDQYAEKWDEIAAIFSRDAVLKGSFDKYADSSKGKRGTGAVDDTFLAEIERWREALAKNLALRNSQLSVRDLNYAVQKIIDRIIFLRICEDRGTEDYGRLQALQNSNRTYIRLMQLFLQADDRYNSGLFHFDQGEKGRPSTPDTLTPDLAVDDAVLKDILKNLYYPDSPFEFSVLPADILGQVYEQFLGKTIRLTASHQARIEEKPEVRKAGGVYYTPGYIVDYIVKNTLGRLLDGEEPDQPKPVPVHKAAEIKVLDPACGSGSFLIVAYQYLLDWHLRQYTADPVTGERDEKKIKRHASGKTPQIYQGAGDIWRLTTSERKRILLNNIHGVDIDSQAVEVTKLSLLLKVLEGETKQHLQRDFIAERQRILPDLGHNIQCGNSLIGPDFYDNQQMTLLDDETQYRINVFDWPTAYPNIMKRGGFDCVIGNPPYIQLSMMEYYVKPVNSYLAEQYSSLMGRMNTYGFFIELALQRVTADGANVSFIVPNTLLTQEYYQPLRKLMLEQRITNITVQLYPVFSGAVVETVVFVAKRTTAQPESRVTIARWSEPYVATDTYEIAQATYDETHENAFITTLSPKYFDLVRRIQKGCPRLGDYFHINQAIALKHDRSACLMNHKEGPRSVPIIDGRNINRYELRWGGDYFTYDITKIHSCKRADIFETNEKIFFRRVGERLTATIDRDQHYGLNTLVVITPKLADTVSLPFVLGIFNSLFADWYYSRVLKSTKKVFSEMQARQIAQIPVPFTVLKKDDDVALHDKMVQLVERMLELNKKKAAEKNPNILKQIETQITITDRQIDRLVYELYGLSEEEVAIVEGRETL